MSSKTVPMASMYKKHAVVMPQFDFAGLPKIPVGFDANTGDKIPRWARAQFIKDTGNSHFKKPIYKTKSRKSTTSKKKRKNVQTITAPKEVLLDYKMIMEQHFSKDPSQVLEVLYNGKKITKVDAESLRPFDNIYLLELSDNIGLDVADFYLLPNLQELHLSCNGLTSLKSVPVPNNMVPFQHLEMLDLSHNAFSNPSSVFDTLSLLPSLKRLNLCGNDLTYLPDDLSLLHELTFLSLEGNHLDEHAFASLATLPSLSKLNISRNKVKSIPYLQREEVDPSEHEQPQDKPMMPIENTTLDQSKLEEEEEDIDVFPSLTMLSIGENLITYDSDLEAMINFPQLEKVFLWGNPIVDRSRDLASARQIASDHQISIILNGPVPPAVKKLNIKNFYNHKLKTVSQFERKINRQQRQRKEKAPTSKLDIVKPQTKKDTSSFFLTQTGGEPEDDVEDVPEDEQDPVDTIRPESSASARPPRPPSWNSGRSSARPPSQSFSNRPSSSASDYFPDPNADWFDLGDMVETMSLRSDDSYIMDYSNEEKTTNMAQQPNPMKDLKFALNHPLKSTTSAFVSKRFTKNTKNQAQRHQNTLKQYYGK
mmetsp:Transcript_13960/g.21127  ORF Transcript_13960/g.21127 Transcript_13960/m.21127 type:complete len:594 (+) Transcript_13960:169-1950(+)